MISIKYKNNGIFNYIYCETNKVEKLIVYIKEEGLQKKLNDESFYIIDSEKKRDLAFEEIKVSSDKFKFFNGYYFKKDLLNVNYINQYNDIKSINYMTFKQKPAIFFVED
jgi:hypothetical protein